MKTIDNIEFFESIKEMPIQRYNDCQNYLMQMSGVGNTMQDIYSHYQKLQTLIANNKNEDALNEMTNLMINHYSILNKINFDSMAFACYIKSINGKLIGNSESDLVEALKNVPKLKQIDIENILEDLKKNLIQN